MNSLEEENTFLFVEGLGVRKNTSQTKMSVHFVFLFHQYSNK